MQSVCVAQLGARMHYAVPMLLHKYEILNYFFTDFYCINEIRFLNYIPKKILPLSLKRLFGRIPYGVPNRNITSFPLFGLEYATRLANSKNNLEKSKNFLWAGKKFCELVLRKGFGNSSAVYTFNTAGLEILQAAKRSGLYAVMEQTIAPLALELEILEKEYDEFPNWQTIINKNKYINELILRELKEWEYADVILCGSEFVKNGITSLGGAAEKCLVIPYGFDFPFYGDKIRQPGKMLKVLTVGEVGLRKGSPYVLDAALQLFGKVELRMVGSINVLKSVESELRKYVELTGAIPRNDIMQHFLWADVFLLPSLCEGSATVVYEALACGLPVICTENTGSIIRNGIEGYIVPIKNSNIIVEKLMSISADKDLYNYLSLNALKRSKEFNLEAYGKKLYKLFKTIEK
jgi:glycosyltransferase involved in cell wall biosynthesis